MSTASSIQSVSSASWSHAAQLAVHPSRSPSAAMAQPRRRRDNAVAEAPGDVEAAPSLPLFEASVTVCENPRAGRDVACVMAMRKPLAERSMPATRELAAIVTPAAVASATRAFRTSRRLVVSGNSLPPAFRAGARRCRGERDGVADGKHRSDAADDGGDGRPESASVTQHWDVAAGAPLTRSSRRDGLRRRQARRCGAMKPPGEDRGRQAGGAGSDDRDIERARKLGGQK